MPVSRATNLSQDLHALSPEVFVERYASEPNFEELLRDLAPQVPQEFIRDFIRSVREPSAQLPYPMAARIHGPVPLSVETLNREVIALKRLIESSEGDSIPAAFAEIGSQLPKLRSDDAAMVWRALISIEGRVRQLSPVHQIPIVLKLIPLMEDSREHNGTLIAQMAFEIALDAFRGPILAPAHRDELAEEILNFLSNHPVPAGLKTADLFDYLNPPQKFRFASYRLTRPLTAEVMGDRDFLASDKEVAAWDQTVADKAREHITLQSAESAAEVLSWTRDILPPALQSDLEAVLADKMRGSEIQKPTIARSVSDFLMAYFKRDDLEAAAEARSHLTRVVEGLTGNAEEARTAITESFVAYLADWNARIAPYVRMMRIFDEQGGIYAGAPAGTVSAAMERILRTLIVRYPYLTDPLEQIVQSSEVMTAHLGRVNNAHAWRSYEEVLDKWHHVAPESEAFLAALEDKLGLTPGTIGVKIIASESRYAPSYFQAAFDQLTSGVGSDEQLAFLLESEGKWSFAALAKRYPEWDFFTHAAEDILTTVEARLKSGEVALRHGALLFLATAHSLDIWTPESKIRAIRLLISQVHSGDFSKVLDLQSRIKKSVAALIGVDWRKDLPLDAQTQVADLLHSELFLGVPQSSKLPVRRVAHTAKATTLEIGGVTSRIRLEIKDEKGQLVARLLDPTETEDAAGHRFLFKSRDAVQLVEDKWRDLKGNNHKGRIRIVFKSAARSSGAYAWISFENRYALIGSDKNFKAEEAYAHSSETAGRYLPSDPGFLSRRDGIGVPSDKVEEIERAVEGLSHKLKVAVKSNLQDTQGSASDAPFYVETLHQLGKFDANKGCPEANLRAMARYAERLRRPNPPAPPDPTRSARNVEAAAPPKQRSRIRIGFGAPKGSLRRSALRPLPHWGQRVAAIRRTQAALNRARVTQRMAFMAPSRSMTLNSAFFIRSFRR